MCRRGAQCNSFHPSASGNLWQICKNRVNIQISPTAFDHATMTAQSDHPGLPQELETGISIVDDEHRCLRQFIGRLRSICDEFDTKQTCAGCPDEKINACDTALLDCVTELLGFMVEHFRNEENLMKDLGVRTKQHERYLLHAEDHANIADRITLLTYPRSRQDTVQAIADTASLIARWLDHHIEHHDVPMLH
jgi:hemerythrin-like metal-binding protein